MTSRKSRRWIAFLIALAAAPVAVAEDLASVETLKVTKRSIGETYRRSLEQLADADRGALIAELAAVEKRFVGNSPELASRQLTRAQLEVVRELASRELESLPPLMVLHHDLTLEHQRHRNTHLRQHSVTMARVLAELYAREGGSDGSRMAAARVLASLGGHLQASGSSASVDLFERSLGLDQRNAAAMLGLAAHYEKRGGPYDVVAGYLERLVASWPEDREAQLRLAINLVRLGRGEPARARLETLLDGSENDDWIDSLATQELARLNEREGRLTDAIDVLEDAIRRRPDDQKLHVQLAFYHDKNREPYEARRLVERLSAGLGPIEPARGLYNRWPRELLTRAREDLREGAEQRLPLLDAALGAPARRGGR